MLPITRLQRRCASVPMTCDQSINTALTRDAGQVNVEDARPVGTTEQVLIDLCIGGDV